MEVAGAATFPGLGTTAVVASTDPAALDEAKAVVEAEVAAIDRACSRFRLDSELMRVNRSAPRPTRVSDLLIEAVEVATRAAQLTGGLVDPTIGTVMGLLGYDRDFASVAKSGAPLSVRIGPIPGWRLIEIDRAAGSVRIPEGTELDLGATAKALCADRAAAAAARRTGAGVMVGLGGDIAVAGPSPEAGWSVRVTADHAAPPSAPAQSVAIRSGGLATSGTAARHWRRGGVTLHHIVDPATGLPAATPWRSVSVAAASCVDANTASTAAIILGEAAPEWLAGRSLPGRLMLVSGDVVTVAGWPDEESTPC